MGRAAARSWGPPDGDGIRASYGSSSRLTRLRRAADGDLSVATLLGEKRTLVEELLRSASQAVKGKTLFARAGNARHVAIAAADYLLEHGWIELSERRRGSVWDIVSFRWLGADDLRAALGLRRQDAMAAERALALSDRPLDPRLVALHDSLHRLGTRTLRRRSALVAKLDAWCSDERSGSRNTFAQYALDDTHGMSSADWRWLELHLDLDALGISRHTPSLWLRGPFQLGYTDGWLDLSLVPDMIALSPETVRSSIAAKGKPSAWLLVENRTSFEDVARRLGDRYAVVWMPGYVPDWWLDAVTRLVELLPLPAFIAADPDPAGIDIAMRAAAPWDSNWTPWGMSPEALAMTGRGKELTDDDHERLKRLAATELPPQLSALTAALATRKRKGEQEALDLPAWLVDQ